MSTTVTPAKAKFSFTNLLASIAAWTVISAAAVSVAENTATAEDTGATKFQTAMAIAQNEAGLAAVDPKDAPTINLTFATLINGAVLVNNLKGIFQHKAKAV